jgi:hypothetical protein
MAVKGKYIALSSSEAANITKIQPTENIARGGRIAGALAERRGDVDPLNGRVLQAAIIIMTQSSGDITKGGRVFNAS